MPSTSSQAVLFYIFFKLCPLIGATYWGVTGCHGLICADIGDCWPQAVVVQYSYVRIYSVPIPRKESIASTITIECPKLVQCTWNTIFETHASSVGTDYYFGEPVDTSRYALGSIIICATKWWQWLLTPVAKMYAVNIPRTFCPIIQNWGFNRASLIHRQSLAPPCRSISFPGAMLGLRKCTGRSSTHIRQTLVLYIRLYVCCFFKSHAFDERYLKKNHTALYKVVPLCNVMTWLSSAQAKGNQGITSFTAGWPTLRATNQIGIMCDYRYVTSPSGWGWQFFECFWDC